MHQTRQLAAIMFTDIVGYSALMGQDEVEALRLLEASNELQKSQVDRHQGKWIKELGDGVIITFGSVLNAVNCAIEIQKEVRHEEGLSLKIVIHTGEVVYRDNDVFGDTVNLTARMEQLGQGDSIILSGAALATVSSIKSVQTAFLGDFTLKNIAQPVSLYAVLGEGLLTPDFSGNELAARDGNEKTISTGEQLVLHVKKVIEENLTNPQLSVTFLCHQLGISRPQLYRKLQAETGFSSSDYIREIRLQKASQLLKNQNLNISEVAYNIGFNNLSYFSKCFQERFGTTPSDFRKKEKRSSGVPIPLDSFIGREREIVDIGKILNRSRLLTLTGPGGTGKTRLATKILENHGKIFRDGAYFVQLAPVQSPEGVIPKIAQILQIQQNALKESRNSIIKFIGNQELLLVLDNFEHVLEAAADVHVLITSCARLKILITSRVILNLTGETEYAVPQLQVPIKDRQYSLNELRQFHSVALLVDRAQSVKPNFELTPENCEAIAAICMQLDGLPLAIELAAARFKLFSPEALLRRLGHKLDILSSSSSNQPDRHKTLRSAIDWSYSLLTPEEQTLFRRLSVFSGGCTMEAAEKVCFHGYGDNLEFLDQILGLVDKSLLQKADQIDGEPRFFMLETLKAFGQDRLKKSLEREDITRRYVSNVIDLVQDAQKHLTGLHQADWLEALEPELDNIRAALAWAEENEDAETGLKVAVSFWRYWISRSMMREGSSWMGRMLKIPMTNHNSIIRCRALNVSGTLDVYTGNLTQAFQKFELALTISKELNDKRELGNALTNLSWVCGFNPDIEQCHDYAKTALKIHDELNDIRGKVRVYNNLSAVEQLAGNMQSTLQINQRSVDLSEEMGDKRSFAYTSARQAWYEIFAGRFVPATKKLDRAIELMRVLFDDHVMAFAFTLKAFNSYYQSDLLEAKKFLKKAQPFWDNEGNPYGTALWNLFRTLIYLREGKVQQAADLMDSVLADPSIKMYGFNEYFYSLTHSQIKLAQGQFDQVFEDLKSSLKDEVDRKVFLFFSAELELIAHLLTKKNQNETGVLLFSRAALLRRENQMPVPPVDRDFYEKTLSQLKSQIDPSTFEKLWSRGKTLTAEECLAML